MTPLTGRGHVRDRAGDLRQRRQLRHQQGDHRHAPPQQGGAARPPQGPRHRVRQASQILSRFDSGLGFPFSNLSDFPMTFHRFWPNILRLKVQIFCKLKEHAPKLLTLNQDLTDEPTTGAVTVP